MLVIAVPTVAISRAPGVIKSASQAFNLGLFIKMRNRKEKWVSRLAMNRKGSDMP
jgi:hypothetical protein